jgi:hypothetical protein
VLTKRNLDSRVKEVNSAVTRTRTGGASILPVIAAGFKLSLTYVEVQQQSAAVVNRTRERERERERKEREREKEMWGRI